MVLGDQPDLTVAGEAADGAAAIRLAREVPADVMVMDVRMPGLDGVAATREICQAAERPRVLIPSTLTWTSMRSPRCAPEPAGSC